MTNEQILWEAINKAGKNGYTGWKSFVPFLPPIGFNKEKAMKLLLHSTEKIIFSPGFAKAFWGEEELDNRGRNLKESFKEVEEHFVDLDEYELECWGLEECPTKMAWKYHLQQMVLVEERLEYIKKFL